MRTIIICCSIVLAMSCGNKSNTTTMSTQDIDNSDSTDEVKALNKRISALNTILTPHDIANMYYPNDVADTEEGSETISITTDGSKIKTTEVTLIHDNLLDDSVRGMKYVLTLVPKAESWRVLSITKTWRCWRDEEDSEWKTTPCT